MKLQMNNMERAIAVEGERNKQLAREIGMAEKDKARIEIEKIEFKQAIETSEARKGAERQEMEL